jgi:hypothetical protein
MKYEKKKECDLFYKNPKISDEMVRVAIDPDTFEQLRSICKRKLINLDFFVPNCDFDFRITVALEMKRNFPDVNSVAHHQRDKDRISYFYENYQIDITVVTESKLDNFGNPILNSGPKTNEIEIELNAGSLFKEKLKLDKMEKNGFQVLTKDYLNAIRSLVKMCEPKTVSQPPLKKMKK